MALKIYERYEPLANPGTAEYPTGSIKNKSAPQNKDGTPIEQDWANDLLGMRDAILAAGNVQADGNVENAVNSQIVEALKAFLVESERVVQTPGSSEDDVMSQKAVTDELNKKANSADLGSAATRDVGTGADEVRTNNQNDSRFAQLSGGANADFTAMPEVGGSPIVESGSNANGSWTKWADGTMVCLIDILESRADSGVWETPVSFPQQFLRSPHVVSTLNTSVPDRASNISYADSSTTGITLYIERSNSTNTRADIIAIGGWK